ncbi:auxin response factor 16-like [Punica granatum]|uniref:Auxin response factor n=1 Tax=Punica granatum TaxID=22663 RepID=A0A6P8CGU7_PUNGR|nr:auxin response factor 16-like [Punica granatum]XP_031383308.1 auxin response factor 16-like [Punica granatum]
MKRNTVEKCLDPQLWHACAGGMVQMPPLNSKVFYFPQGHAEHAQGPVDFGNSHNIPPLVLCRLAAIKYMADRETDEVFARITLVPVKVQGLDLDNDGLMDHDGAESPEKAASFAKTLTQSDANNGGGFSVPRYCAETIFPRLDYSAEPPVQTIIAKDVHGESWKFRHIYRGTPRRHLLTTGWSNFVNQKKLVAGDSIVFLRAENGDLCVGIRRVKRGGFGGGPEYGSGWNSSSGPFGGYSMFMREDGNNNPMQKASDNGGVGRVTAESVVRAAALAASGRPFDVAYYPRAGTPEFFVKASSVSHSMTIQWCSGMRFKMPFETEDSSRISWFMGTISLVQVADPIHWPNSPWRLLQVAWDEPDLLQNLKRVSPWLVELVSTMPSIHLSPFSPPRKKLRVPPTADFSLMEQLQLPSSFPSNPLLMGQSNSPLCYIPDNIIPAGIQGARHAHYGLSPSDLSLNKLHSSSLFLNKSRHHLDNHNFAPPLPTRFNHEPNGNPNTNNISCLLTMATPANHFKENGEKKSGSGGSPHILLFGQLILTQHQNSETSSSGPPETSSSGPPETSSEEDNFQTRRKDNNNRKTELGLGVETGHCKVFMESEDVGRTLDLSVLGSYEELYRNLAEMFGIEGSEMLRNILYRDAAGAIKHAGEEPFSDFLKTAKRLTIPAGSSIRELLR